MFLATICRLKRLHFLDDTSTPLKFLLVDQLSNIINPMFLDHEQQDQLVITRLLASMTTLILSKMVGLKSTCQI